MFLGSNLSVSITNEMKKTAHFQWYPFSLSLSYPHSPCSNTYKGLTSFFGQDDPTMVGPGMDPNGPNVAGLVAASAAAIVAPTVEPLRAATAAPSSAFDEIRGVMNNNNNMMQQPQPGVAMVPGAGGMPTYYAPGGECLALCGVILVRCVLFN